MKYRKSEAKEWARQNITGLWGATHTPYTPDYNIDEEGFRFDICYCREQLELQGMFIDGMSGEYWRHTINERKRLFKIAVEEAKGEMFIMPYTHDPVLDNVVEMSKYAEDIGADLVIVSNPMFHPGGSMTEEGVYQYFKYIADRVNIGVAIFHTGAYGYEMRPQLISRIAEIPNIVALKDSIQDHASQRLTRILCGGKIVVSDPVETNWWTNMTIYGQQALFATFYVLRHQSKKLKLVKEYTDLYRKGEVAKALEACKRLENIRRTIASCLVPSKWCAFQKYWCGITGMTSCDGRVRLPAMELTNAEKQAIKAAAESTELV